MCHPNLVPLLALQCSFSPVEPVELGSVTATCWAYMPVMDSECLCRLPSVVCVCVYEKEGQGIPSIVFIGSIYVQYNSLSKMNECLR